MDYFTISGNAQLWGLVVLMDHDHEHEHEHGDEEVGNGQEHGDEEEDNGQEHRDEEEDNAQEHGDEEEEEEDEMHTSIKELLSRVDAMEFVPLLPPPFEILNDRTQN